MEQRLREGPPPSSLHFASSALQGACFFTSGSSLLFEVIEKARQPAGQWQATHPCPVRGVPSAHSSGPFEDAALRGYSGVDTTWSTDVTEPP